MKHAIHTYFKNSTTGELIKKFDPILPDITPFLMNHRDQVKETTNTDGKGFVKISRHKFAIEKRKLDQHAEVCGYIRATINPPFDGEYIVKVEDGKYHVSEYTKESGWDILEVIAWSYFGKTNITEPF